MKPIRIDFAPRSLRRTLFHTPASHWLLCAAGLALCASAAVATLDMLAQRHSREVQIGLAYAGRAAPPPPPKQASVAPAQAGAVNAVIERLNLPWRDLQEALEAATPTSVALLAIEPDAKTHTLRITAEAKNSDDMVAYIEQIKLQAFFLNAQLSKHDISEQDPNRPLRFQLDVEWSDKGGRP